MINVVQEIVDKLRTVYPSAQYDIYTERIEQGFSAPCFSIRQLRADVTPYPSGLHEIVQHMDVRFFPSDGRPQEQCRETAQTLTLLLRRTESLRGSNLSWEITDEVLHFFADYRRCREVRRYSDGEFADYRRNGERKWQLNAKPRQEHRRLPAHSS
ncbi:MAG: DUF6838 family protein [Butyricicoccus sp.]